MNKQLRPMENSLPFSDAMHNPYWCGGDCNGRCVEDDPCWSCIQFLHKAAMQMLPKRREEVYKQGTRGKK
jgi:hypothetical protein